MSKFGTQPLKGCQLLDIGKDCRMIEDERVAVIDQAN